MDVPPFIALIALPLLGSPLIYLLGRLGLTRGLSRIGPWSAVIVLAASWIPFALSVPDIVEGRTPTYSLGSVALALDGLGLLLAAVALALGLLVALYSGPYLGVETGTEKFSAMLVAMVGVMIGLGCATDLFNLWIWFEAMAVCSYLLVAFYREQPAALEAGVKYLVQSAAGSTLVLLGIALVLAHSGTLRFEDLRRAESSGMLLAAGALFVIGFGVKAALVPLHTWLPDAHSQAPSGISAMLSGVVIEAGLVAMLRSLGAVAGVTNLWGPLLLAFGVVNMLLGNLMALRQVQVKRLLAYSSLAHTGYMLVGLGIFVTAHDVMGAQGSLFHLFNHGLMKGLAFLAAGSLLFALHLQRGDIAPLTVQDLSGAARRYPLVALTLSVAVLGLGGLPPLAGFMSKWQIFVAGFRVGAPWAGWLVAFAALNSVLSLAYYAPLVNAVYRREPSQAVQEGGRLSWAMSLLLALLGLAVVAIGVWPNLMTWLTAPAGEALARAFGG